MKNYKLFIPLFVSIMNMQVPAFAQKIVYEHKIRTVLVDDKPYIKVDRISDGINPDLSVTNLAEKELMVFKYEDECNCYEAIFMATQEKAYIKDLFLGQKAVGKILYANKLVKGDSIDPEARKRYLFLYGSAPTKISKRVGTKVNDALDKIEIKIGGRNNEEVEDPKTDSPASSQDPYRLVERNRSSYISTSFDEITQDFNLIGTFENTTETGSGVIHRIITVSLPNGTTVAEAKSDNIASEGFEIFTMVDRRRTRFKVKFVGNPVQEIVEYLVKNRYL